MAFTSDEQHARSSSVRFSHFLVRELSGDGAGDVLVRVELSARGEVVFHVCKARVKGCIKGLAVHGMVLECGYGRIGDGYRGRGICRAVQDCGVITGMAFVDVLWRGEVGGRSLETGKVYAESRLRGVRRDFLAGVALDEQAHQLLALLLIFRQEMDGFSVGMAMHGVARTYHVDLSEGKERENGVDDGRDGGEGEGGDGGRGPGWTGFMDLEVVDRIEEAEHTG